jgi:RPA family protein
MPQRDTAIKLRIKDITGGELKRGASDWDSILITPFNEEAGRVRVLATVVKRYTREDGKYAVLTLDDATETITLRAFNTDVAMLEGIEEGDTIDAIGGVREYEEELYIATESATKITDPNWELVRKLELALKIKELGGDASASLEEEAGDEDTKEAVKGIIEKLDGGDGAKYLGIVEETGLGDEKLEAILGELMDAGEVYEPKIGKFKRV